MVNILRSVLVSIACFCLLILPAGAKNLKFALDDTINQDALSTTSTVSVSVREVKSGQVVYERESKRYLHPASTLKTFTTYSILKTLGKSYQLQTSLYMDSYGNVYLKLGADPMLTGVDLRDLFQKVKEAGLTNIRGSLIIDDSIIDQKLLGIGWMWDDELSPYMPKFSPYNLDHNLVRVEVLPTKRNFKPQIVIKPYYPLSIINDAYTSGINDLKLNKRPWESCANYYLSGPISTRYILNLPVNNPKNYFIYKLRKALEYSNIKLNQDITVGKVPEDATLIANLNNSLLEAIKHTNTQSDNMYAESLFKIAGGWYNRDQGSTKNGYKAFNAIYSAIGADASGNDLADASGVSHNNLITTDWMSLALHKIYHQPDYQIFLSTLPRPAQKGTLKYRLKDLQPYLWAKTGTLANATGITGYLKTQSGRMYCFAILVQNFKGQSINAKKLENKIIRQLSYY